MELTKAEFLQDAFGTTDWCTCDDISRELYEKAIVQGNINLPLPYEAPNHPHLPSMEEIGIAMETHSLRHPMGLFWICRVGPCVVKVALELGILQEAENLLYLEKHTKVRAPKLYAAYRTTESFVKLDEGDVMNVLVMEFLEGDCMSWDRFMAMENRDQENIMRGLSEQIQLLRSIKPAGDGYYGRIDYQGWIPTMMSLRSRKPGLRGPYDTYDDYLSAIFESAEERCAMCTWTPDYIPEFVEFLKDMKRVLPASKEYKPVLTHFDLKWQNIMVRPINETAEDGKGNDWHVTIIDWDTLGWAPAYMQKASLWERLPVPKEVREREEFCGFSKDQYAKEVELLHWDTMLFPLL